MKIIGLSGAQGAGKSSLLNELALRGHRIDGFRVSRAVQKELGLQMNDVMNCSKTMIRFQHEVYAQKLKNEQEVIAKDELFFAERTFADIAAYSALWTWKFVQRKEITMAAAMDFLVPFCNECAEAQFELYACTLLLPYMDHIVWEEDPHRGKKGDVDLVFTDMERFLDIQLPIQHRRYKISSKTIGDRADEVESFLKTL